MSSVAFTLSGAEPSLAAEVFDVAVLANAATEVQDRVRHGVEVQRLDPLMLALGTNHGELAELLGVSPRTVARLRKRSGRLDARASDRVARLVRVFELAVTTLGDADRARAWLRTDNQALGGSRPLAWLDTDAGTTEVARVLGRLAHGVFG